MSGLPAEFGDRVHIELVENTAPGAEEVIRANGFQSHGLIVRQGDKVIFRAADHGLRMEEAREAIARALGRPLGPAPASAAPSAGPN